MFKPKLYPSLKCATISAMSLTAAICSEDCKLLLLYMHICHKHAHLFKMVNPILKALMTAYHIPISIKVCVCYLKEVNFTKSLYT